MSDMSILICSTILFSGLLAINKFLVEFVKSPYNNFKSKIVNDIPINFLFDSLINLLVLLIFINLFTSLFGNVINVFSIIFIMFSFATLIEIVDYYFIYKRHLSKENFKIKIDISKVESKYSILYNHISNYVLNSLNKFDLSENKGSYILMKNEIIILQNILLKNIEKLEQVKEKSKRKKIKNKVKSLLNLYKNVSNLLFKKDLFNKNNFDYIYNIINKQTKDM